MKHERPLLFFIMLIFIVFVIWFYNERRQQTNVENYIINYEKNIRKSQDKYISYNDNLKIVVANVSCEYRRKSITPSINKNLSCPNDMDKIYNSVQLNSDQRKQLRQLVDEKVSTYWASNLSQNDIENIDSILSFYNQIIHCTNVNECDKSSIKEYFSQPMLDFANTYCFYYEHIQKKDRSKLSKDDFLVEFIISLNLDVKNLSDDSGRESLFICERHRLKEKIYRHD